MYVVTLTGHRDIDYYELKQLLIPELTQLMEAHPDLVAYWGGAPGGDITFGLTCIKLGIPVELFLPDPYYFERTIKAKHPDWEASFNLVKEYSKVIHYSSESNNWRNNFARNEHMIAPANLVFIAYRYDDIDAYTAAKRPRKGGTSHGIQTVKKYHKNYKHLKVT